MTLSVLYVLLVDRAVCRHREVRARGGCLLGVLVILSGRVSHFRFRTVQRAGRQSDLSFGLLACL